MQRHAAHRAGRVAPQQFARLVQLEAVAAQLAHDAQRRQAAQQAEQRVGVRAGGDGEVGGGLRSFGHQLGQAQARGDVDYLGAPAGGDQLGQAGADGRIGLGRGVLGHGGLHHERTRATASSQRA